MIMEGKNGKPNDHYRFGHRFIIKSYGEMTKDTGKARVNVSRGQGKGQGKAMVWIGDSR